MSMPQTQLAPVKQYIDICFEVEGFLLKSKSENPGETKISTAVCMLVTDMMPSFYFKPLFIPH